MAADRVAADGGEGARVRQLFIDLDGVLADFDGYYETCFGVRPGRGVVDPPGFWDNINTHGTFYASLPPMPDAAALWAGARRFHREPIILTGVPYSVENAENHKRAWVREHVDPRAVVICCASKDKRLHGKIGDVLVDDWHKYRALWEAMGGVFVLHTSADASLLRLAQLFDSERQQDDAAITVNKRGTEAMG